MAENETKVEETTVEETKVEETNPDLEAANREIVKLKALISKANSEAADNKRKLREKMSEEEKNKAALEEQQASMMAELEALRKEKTLSTYTSQFMTSGFDSELATVGANALVDGDMTKFFATLKSYTDNIKKSAIADAMANQSGMTNGQAAQTITQEQFNAMSLSERVELFNKDKDLYNKLIKGE